MTPTRPECSSPALPPARCGHGTGLCPSGESSSRRELRPWDQLTPQELQIARMAADGMSNRDIGQELYISHRTVSAHLYRIFPKLGITSRSQLHAAIS